MDAFEHKGSYVLVLDRAEYETLVCSSGFDVGSDFIQRVQRSELFQGQPAFALTELFTALCSLDKRLSKEYT